MRIPHRKNLAVTNIPPNATWGQHLSKIPKCHLSICPEIRSPQAPISPWRGYAELLSALGCAEE